MSSHAVSGPVIINITGEETGDLLRALGDGFDVVLADEDRSPGSSDSYASLVSVASTTTGG